MGDVGSVVAPFRFKTPNGDSAEKGAFTGRL